MDLALQTRKITKGRVTQMSVVNEGQVTVAQVNETVQEAGDMPKLTAKQVEKLEAKKQREWNKMISRKEAYEMLEKAFVDSDQRMQMLFIQNRTLTELIINKGIATEEEINELSKTVIESIFGTPPVDEKEKEEETANA
jgi:hypothetical protein